jgi:ATP-binding cassette, subfamily B, bacterial
LPSHDRGQRVSEAEKTQARQVSLRRIGRLFGPYRWPLAVVTLIIVASSIIAMASPFLLRAVIDRALPQQDLRLLVWLVIGMVGVAAATSALGVVQTWISTAVGQKVMHRLRTSVFSHLHRQSVGFFTRTRTGEVQSRITNDIGGMEAVVTTTATSIASNLTTTIATIAAMVALSWQLSMVSLVVLPPAIYLTRRVARMRRTITEQRQRELADLNVTIEEGLSVSGAQLSKTLSTGAALVDRFTASSRRLIDLELRSELAGRWRMASMSIIFAAIPAVIYLSAGLPFSRGALSIGTLVAFTALQGGLFRPLMGLLNVGVTLTASLALFQRIFEYLDLPVEVDDPATPRTLDRVEGHLRLENVSFTYPGNDVPALSGVSLDVPAGTSLALVGETGSGKSTLAALIARLYDPTAGRVTIDGVDVRDLRLARLRQLVATAFEDPVLFSMSARENVALGRPDATDAEIEAAVEVAQAQFVHELPYGLDTRIGEQGMSLSGGQRQRLALARAVLARPAVLVLDDTLSALDIHTEALVEEALKRVLVGVTGIVVAHRASTVLLADRVALLQDGTITHVGTHSELLETVPAYRALLSAELEPEDELLEVAS